MEIKINCADEILGGDDWRAELRLQLDEDGEAQLEARQVHTSDNGTSFDVWHGRTREWSTRLSIGSLLVPDAEKLAALAERVKPLLERVHAGHSVNWDGSNHRGKLTEDAQEASGDIEEIFYRMETEDWCRDDIEAWNAYDWIFETRKEGITADTTDDELAAIAEADESQAERDGVRLDGSTLEARTEARDEMRGDRDDEADEA